MFTMEITRLIERCRQGDADALGFQRSREETDKARSNFENLD